MTHNPYVAGPPIADDGGFFGRGSELAEWDTSLGHRSLCYEYPGPSRIGKTSLMHCLIRKIRRHSPRAAIVYLDCKGRTSRDGREFLRWIDGKLRAEIERHLSLPPAPAAPEDALLQITERASAEELPMFLFLDELQTLADGWALSTELFAVLRSLPQQPGSRLSYVVASLRRVGELSQEADASRFPNMFTTRELGPLDRTSACRMVEDPAAQVGIVLRAGSGAEIYRLCGGHPFLTAFVARELAWAVQAGRAVDPASPAWADECLRKVHDYLRDLFAGIPQEQFGAVREIVHSEYVRPYPRELSPAAHALTRTGLCVLQGDYLRPTGELFAAYLKERVQVSIRKSITPAPEAPKKKPRMFIGSSGNGLPIAQALQAALTNDADVEIWNQGVFGLSQGTLETLVGCAGRFDYAVLVLTPDDMTTKRGKTKPSARDNVVFELGLFMGALGRERTFIVHREDEALDLPTDLAGVTTARFRMQSSGNLDASVGVVCHKIRQEMERTAVTSK
jgi:predicted nucleotide-binding protein